jgi:hypothetical protein
VGEAVFRLPINKAPGNEVVGEQETFPSATWERGTRTPVILSLSKNQFSLGAHEQRN